MIAIAPLSNRKQYSAMEYIINHIFLVFKKLTHLIFTESSYLNIVELRFSPPIHFCSSTLLVLKIKISDFYICLFLVDGRFSQLNLTLSLWNQATFPYPQEFQIKFVFIRKKKKWNYFYCRAIYQL